MSEQAPSHVERRTALARDAVPEVLLQALDACRGGLRLRGLRTLWRLRAGLAGVGRDGLWRDAERGPRLRSYRASLRVGEAELRYTLEPSPEGTRLQQTLSFWSCGRLGDAYFAAVGPAHRAVFAAMLRGVVRRAEAR